MLQLAQIHIAHALECVNIKTNEKLIMMQIKWAILSKDKNNFDAILHFQAYASLDSTKIKTENWCIEICSDDLEGMHFSVDTFFIIQKIETEKMEETKKIEGYGKAILNIELDILLLTKLKMQFEKSILDNMHLVREISSANMEKIGDKISESIKSYNDNNMSTTHH